MAQGKYDLDAALDADYPESFRFEDEGQKLVGTFRRVDEGFTEYGETKIVVLEVEAANPETGELEKKELGVWLFHEALLSQLKKARPKVGQTIGIKYLGKKQGKGKYSYHNYRVVAEPQEGASFDWDALDDDEGFTQDDGTTSWSQEPPTTATTSPPSSDWGQPASEPSGWGQEPASIDTERARFVALNAKKTAHEIYTAASKVWAERGLGVPADRAAVQSADVDTLRAVNDALEAGVF